MAYRDGAQDELEATTADGLLEVAIEPRAIRMTVGQRTLQIAERFATLIEHHASKPAKDRRTTLRIEGRIVIARDVPQEDLGVWVETDPGAAKVGWRRIFGVEPVSLLDPDGLDALAELDRVGQRLRAELAELAGNIVRAFEIGNGLDKVLLVDHGDHFEIFARRLFRDRAAFAMAIYGDGRIVVPNGKTTREVVVTSRFGVTVWGDYIRFANPDGEDLARVSIPWISSEDRLELARRIGQLIDKTIVDPIPWFPMRAGADQSAAASPTKRKGAWKGYGMGVPRRPRR
ncbi:MAG TPA: hypothetical protein VGM90_04325 [Kofleriaceae bacterium]